MIEFCLTVIQCFTSTKSQQEATKAKSPPFFDESTSYYNWLSTWSRFIIERSYSNEKSRYSDLFYACRSAIRSEAGIGILEFLLPLMVLDTICFGGEFERNATVVELNKVLSSCIDGEKVMEKIELQKAIAVVFMVIETFQSWANTEIEDRFSSQRPGKSYSSKEVWYSNDPAEKSDWPSDESVVFIEDLLKVIPLSLCAKAASNVGMFALSLRFLEIEARKKHVDDLYEAAISIDIDSNETMHSAANHSLCTKYGKGIELGLGHLLFGELNDCDSMNAVSKYRTQQDIIEKVREKETYADWDGVLKSCEQASQIRWLKSNKEPQLYSCLGSDSDSTEIEYLDTAYLKALLELGQLDTVLNHVRGRLHMSSKAHTSIFDSHSDNSSIELLIPYAVQASWRLSRWDVLDQLLNPLSDSNGDLKATQKVDLEGQYNISLGRSMLALHQKDEVGVMAALKKAREAIIPSLSVAAQENYIRAYPYLLKLHCLREVEDLCSV